MSALSVSYVGLLIATLGLGHQVSKTPLRQLGRRPVGRELWGWLTHFSSDGVGIWGYDSSLGCWSPPIRLILHASLAGFLYSYFGAIALVGYAVFCFYNAHMVPNVSHPGGARDHKIQRVPQFPDVVTQLDVADANVWRCVVAQESHEDTEHKFAEIAGALLTGEPCGRQIWTTQTVTRARRKKVDEKVVQELATGGRNPRAFNPGQNPNRCVCMHVCLCVPLNAFPVDLSRCCCCNHWTHMGSLL